MTLKELLEAMDGEPLGLDEIAHKLGTTKAEALKQLLKAHNEGWITYFTKEEHTNLYFVFKGLE